jgi:hypothetical protein
MVAKEKTYLEKMCLRGYKAKGKKTKVIIIWNGRQ